MLIGFADHNPQSPVLWNQLLSNEQWDTTKLCWNVMQEPLSDRQVMTAIGLTCLVVIGLVLITVSPVWNPPQDLQWRDSPDPPRESLAIWTEVMTKPEQQWHCEPWRRIQTPREFATWICGSAEASSTAKRPGGAVWINCSACGVDSWMAGRRHAQSGSIKDGGIVADAFTSLAFGPGASSCSHEHGRTESLGTRIKFVLLRNGQQGFAHSSSSASTGKP